jgi:hypothetical protein
MLAECLGLTVSTSASLDCRLWAYDLTSGAINTAWLVWLNHGLDRAPVCPPLGLLMSWGPT